MAVEVGRVCIKRRGKDRGERCVITNLISENFAEILGVGIKKRRKCNLKHLEFLDEKIAISGTDDEIRKSIELKK
jgi:ribosomal protein L14E/L6E/L27E